MELRQRAPEEVAAILSLKVVEAEKARDAAYRERNACVAVMARMAIGFGWKVGIRETAIEGWDEAWHNCVWIDFPTGQASWHYHDDDAELFHGLGDYDNPWDGHTTPEKYERLDAFSWSTVEYRDIMPDGVPSPS